MSCPPTRNHDSVQSSHPVGLDSRWTILGICFALAAITLAVFGRTLRHEFVNYDDDAYVYDNPAVTGGLTFRGIGAAFTQGSAENWDPLTTISHMLDCQLYGLNAGGHHMTNVLLHAATAILLFLVLRRMTGLRPDKDVGATAPQAGAMWPSAFVAAVFAIHPLRVESVAWVTERKDVLSGLFFMLTLWAYVRYVQNRAKAESRESRAQAVPALDPRPSTLDYGLMMLCFVLGLMSKAMLVTLPFVLLLLDYWPLKRFPGPVEGLKKLSLPMRLILEKIPLLMLSLVSCVVAIIAQGHAVQPLEKFPLSLRIGNALVSCVAYGWQMFYPAGLAVYYPYPAGGLPAGEVILAVLILLAISVGVFHWRRPCPYLFVGWLWYLVMLTPVIGLVQISGQARADRYTYLPQIGLYLALTWAVVKLSAGWRFRQPVLGGLGAIMVAALSACSFIQTAHWHDSETLWAHTLACTSNNAIAHYNFGMTILPKGRVDEALAHFQKAVEIDPNFARAQVSLGAAFFQTGRTDEAITHFQKALTMEITPDPSAVYYDLGIALLQQGRVDEAIVHFQKAVEIRPGDVGFRNVLGKTLFQKRRMNEAIEQYQAVLKILPGQPEACNYLGRAAWVLATSPEASIRNGAKALELAGQMERLSNGKDPLVVMVLAAADAEAGRFPEAVAAAERARQLAVQHGNNSLADVLATQIKLYQAGTPFRDAGMPVAPTPLIPP
jgi:Flp pilus assembly protein TadD